MTDGKEAGAPATSHNIKEINLERATSWYLDYLVNEIHTTVMATVDGEGRPVTAAIDMMHADEDGLYFLTAKGKALYVRLTATGFVALTGMRGQTTMDTIALSLRGRVTEVGPAFLPLLFERNPYMAEIYPTEASREALTVFRVFEGEGEWFDLSARPIERASFAFGGAVSTPHGYVVDANACIGCGRCLEVCPQDCIELKDGTASIVQKHCLHCGGCLEVCPTGAINRT